MANVGSIRRRVEWKQEYLSMIAFGTMFSAFQYDVAQYPAEAHYTPRSIVTWGHNA